MAAKALVMAQKQLWRRARWEERLGKGWGVVAAGGGGGNTQALGPFLCQVHCSGPSSGQLHLLLVGTVSAWPMALGFRTVLNTGGDAGGIAMRGWQARHV